jgi:hypothetical protein
MNFTHEKKALDAQMYLDQNFKTCAVIACNDIMGQNKKSVDENQKFQVKISDNLYEQSLK